MRFRSVRPAVTAAPSHETFASRGRVVALNTECSQTHESTDLYWFGLSLCYVPARSVLPSPRWEHSNVYGLVGHALPYQRHHCLCQGNKCSIGERFLGRVQGLFQAVAFTDTPGEVGKRDRVTVLRPSLVWIENAGISILVSHRENPLSAGST